ncbi:IL-21 [Arapaima gigas]
MMKLSVCTLITIAVAVAMCSSMDKRQNKIKEVLREVTALSQNLQHDGLLLNTPSRDIDECCFLSALPCFRDNVRLVNTIRKSIFPLKISHSLNSTSLMNAVYSTCVQYGVQDADCAACDSYPKKNSKEFIKELERLLEKKSPEQHTCVITDQLTTDRFAPVAQVPLTAHV